MNLTEYFLDSPQISIFFEVLFRGFDVLYSLTNYTGHFPSEHGGGFFTTGKTIEEFLFSMEETFLGVRLLIA